MRYKLNVGLLLPGDIILVGYNNKESKEIQKRTNSKFSHAMLYWYDSIIHAADIVITGNPSRMLFNDDDSVCVLRLKENYRNPVQISLLIGYARTFVGTFYDKKALVAMKKGKKVVPKENRQMCSRFVAQCYDHVMLDLVEDYDNCTPEDIFKSDILYPLPNPLVEASQDDIAFAESYDVTIVQFQAIKDFLIALKKKLPNEDIVSLLQLESYIDKEPSKGDMVLSLLEKTDYFNLWKLEKEHSPFLYNVDAFKNKWKDQSANQAFSVIHESKRIIDEKQNDIEVYKEKIKKIGDIEYYRKMIELRNNIIETSRERIEVAEKILSDLNIVKIKYPWL